MTALTTHRPLVIAAVMAANFMIAIEATIVSTAMPQIVAQLGGLELYSWVFAAFLLTQTATTVVFGKLSDLKGRKAVMLSGIAIFLVGSILCGFAWSMPSLIVFRLVQGVGAGAVQPVAMTIVGDLYSLHERGKIQGWLASVWAVSAIIGPLVGGLIIQYWSWAWIFWMNVPIGLLASAGFWAFLHEKKSDARGQIDHLSAGIFTVAIAAIMADLTAFSTAGRVEISVITLIAVVAVAAVRRPGAALARTDDLARALGAQAHRRGQRLVAVRRHGHDRAYDLPADFRSGGDGEVAARSPALRSPAMVLGWPIGATLSPHLWKRFGVRAIIRLGGAPDPARGARVRFPQGRNLAPRRGRRIGAGRLRHGAFEQRLDRADPGDRRLVRARQRHRLLHVRAHARQHLRRDRVRRHPQPRADPFRLRRGELGTASKAARRRRRGVECGAQERARSVAPSDLRLAVRGRADRRGDLRMVPKVVFAARRAMAE